MGKVIGIDLGTTNSCVAFLDGETPVVIPNSEGSRTTPSVVAIAGQGERLVGQIAKRQSITNPENSVAAVKRLIGRKFADPQVQQHLTVCTYEVMAAENGDCVIRLGDKHCTPPEVSAMVLTKMKQVAEEYLGEEITEAVVTVPAYFDDAQRQATKDAGRIAGLDVLRILNEPTAAALAYGAEKERNERIAVYDLGGGTFDISILELHGGVFEVKATNGDTYLGGEDFDRHVVDWLAEQFLHDNGIDLRQDKMALQRLKEAAERAKHELSSSLSTEINLPFIAADASGPKHFVTTLTRGKLEQLTETLVQRTLEPCRIALADAGFEASQIDQVILVGGQTRMPLVQQTAEEFFGRKPNKRVDPDEVVAVGAALQGGILRGQLDHVLLLDVTPLSLGVETAGGVFTKIVPRNTTIPTRHAEVFSTAVDHQPFVEVHVLQGEREMAIDCKSLARFQLLGIPPAPRGVPQIQVEFDIDANGMVSVSARDLGTGREQKVRVVSTSGLTEDEIARLCTEASTAKQSDEKRREAAEVKLRLEGLLYTVERSLTEYQELLKPDDKGALEKRIEASRVALTSGASADALRSAMIELEKAASRLGEAIYAGAKSGEASGTARPAGGESTLKAPSLTMARRDFYEILGVARDADAAELKRAYRDLAMRFHPDKNPGSKEAEERFKEVSEAYAVLSEPDQRARYDRLGPDGVPDFGTAVGSFTDLFENLFGDLFGRRKRQAGRDVRYTLELDFVEAARGCQRTIVIPTRADCEACQGTGAQGGEAALQPCGTCQGRGEVKVQQGFFSLGKQCPGCGGRGKVVVEKCSTCGGASTMPQEREFTVTIPPGTVDGGIRRVPGQGEPGRRGGSAGDLNVVVRVKPHPIFKREGNVVSCEVPLSIGQATLGATVDVPTLDGKVEMRVPPGTQSGTVFRLRGKGIPGAGGRGDAHVRVVVETPQNLTPPQRALLEQFTAACGDEVTPQRRGFFAKVRELFP